MIVGISWSKCIIWAYHCVLFRLYTFCIQKEKKNKTQVFLKNKKLPYEQECSLMSRSVLSPKMEQKGTMLWHPVLRGWVCLLGVRCLTDSEDTRHLFKGWSQLQHHRVLKALPPSSVSSTAPPGPHNGHCPPPGWPCCHVIV